MLNKISLDNVLGHIWIIRKYLEDLDNVKKDKRVALNMFSIAQKSALDGCSLFIEG